VSRSFAYWVAVAIGAVLCAALCVAARKWPGAWVRQAGRALALVLVADALVYLVATLARGEWSVRWSLPLALCDVALVVAAAACWRPDWQLPVELTYFWGLAGTLQAVVTPDLGAAFPELDFFMFVVGHLGIVTAAVFLVVGQRRRPRRGAVLRVFAITVAYTAFVGLFNWLADANYMYLARPPRRTSLISLLGPWPWYIASGTAVAAVLLLLLDAPFWRARSRDRDRGRAVPEQVAVS
jgi:hypothetical integral membrane protein (TIGR02206 family)